MPFRSAAKEDDGRVRSVTSCQYGAKVRIAGDDRAVFGGGEIKYCVVISRREAEIADMDSIVSALMQGAGDER